MFNKLKDKLKSWTKKVSENTEQKEIKELEVPQKFDVAKQKYEPDTKKIKE